MNEDVEAEGRGGKSRNLTGLDSIILGSLVLVVFLAGLVFVCGKAMSASAPADRELRDAGDEVMRKMGVLIGAATSIQLRRGESARRTRMLADLDGDSHTGSAEGLEDAVMEQDGPKRLSVSVAGRSVGGHDTVILTDLLDPSAAPAFLMKRSASGDRINVRLRLRKDNSSVTFDEDFACTDVVLGLPEKGEQ